MNIKSTDGPKAWPLSTHTNRSLQHEERFQPVLEMKVHSTSRFSSPISQMGKQRPVRGRRMTYST